MLTKSGFAAAAMAAVLSLAPAAFAGVDVGVSVQVSQPGVYGRVDIGRFPQPQVIVQQPVIIAAPRVVMAQPQPQPVYLWVPPGHQKKWGKHCSRYNACGVPVYFVEDRWYRDHVHAGPGRESRGRGHDDHPGRGHGHGRGRDKD